MLSFRIHYVIEYAFQFEREVNQAFFEFFGDRDLTNFSPDTQERLNSLFNEFLTFEFKNSRGVTFAAEYFFKNPDHFPVAEIDELRQMVETQRHEPFDIVSKVPGKSITIYGVMSGRQYVVVDIQGSLNSPDFGTIFNRIAKVNRKWYFIGSDPLCFPVTQTERSKKMLSRDAKKTHPSSSKEYRDILIAQDKNITRFKTFTSKEIKNKRKSLIKNYEKLAMKYHLKIAAEKIINFIFQENYQTNHADFYVHLHTKVGLSESFIFNHAQLFSDMWNFFPHKCLGGKSPAEMYQNQLE